MAVHIEPVFLSFVRFYFLKRFIVKLHYLSARGAYKMVVMFFCGIFKVAVFVAEGWPVQYVVLSHKF